MSKKIYRILSLLLCFFLIFEQSGFAQIAGTLDISGYFTQLRQSFTPDKFRPLHLRYLQYLPETNNFRLLIDVGTGFKPVPTGELSKGSVGTEQCSVPNIEDETKVLLSYFFIGLSLPNDSFWVNLRPDSPDNIIDPLLAQTDVGKILLEADLQLKKDTAQYTSPQTPEGREYWDKLYQKAGEIFGSENITIPTLTRPWIVPDEIIIREAEDNAYIYKATLKVMLEEDYLLKVEGGRSKVEGYEFKDERLKQLNKYSSELIRELIIPKITKEVNTSKRYAPLRQVYYSLILAQWFKSRFRAQSTVNRPQPTEQNNNYLNLIDSRDLAGLIAKEPYSKETYFAAYQKSFQQGEYNIKEPRYTPYGQTIRSYFSGGINIIAEPTGRISAQGPIEDIPPYTTEFETDSISFPPALRALSAARREAISDHPEFGSLSDFGEAPRPDRAEWPGASADLRYHKRPRGTFQNAAPEPTISDYVDDVNKAAARGDIIYGVTAGKIFAYTHMRITSAGAASNGYLKVGNTRQLSKNAEKVFLSLLRGIKPKGALRALEIGAGAGRAVSDMSIISEKQKRGVIIDTCGSLDSIAPRFRLLVDNEQIRKWIYEFVQQHPDEELEGLTKYLGNISDMTRERKAKQSVSLSYRAIPFELALALQNRDDRFKIFELFTSPLIHRQYIGKFLDGSIVFGGKYHFIHEEIGGLHYATDKRTAVEKLASLLDDDGICYMGGVGEIMLSLNMLLNGLILVTAANSNAGIFIKVNGRYAAPVLRCPTLKRLSNGGVFKVDDFEVLLNALAQETEATNRPQGKDEAIKDAPPSAPSPAAKDEQSTQDMQRKKDTQGRFVKEDGKSPEDMVRILSKSIFRDTSFSIDQYRRLWQNKFNEELPESTAYSDLRIAIEKRCIESAESAHQYRLTLQGKNAGEELARLAQYEELTIRMILVKNPKGIHVRPSTTISELANKLEESLHIAFYAISLRKTTGSPLTDIMRLFSLEIQNDELILISARCKEVANDGRLEAALDFMERLFHDEPTLENKERFGKYLDEINRLRHRFEDSEQASAPITQEDEHAPPGAPPAAQPSAPSPAAPDAPISDFQKDVGEILPYKHYSLVGGATLLTRLDDIYSVDAEGIYEVQDNKEGSISLRDRVRNYGNERSSLGDVEKGLSISILDRIRKLDDMRKASQQPDMPITILDWGCGNGTALVELSDRFRKEGISNVRLIGFSDKYYGEWNRAGQDITFIWDTIKGFPLYFGEYSVGLIYSHYGLSHIVWRYFEHFDQLRSILAPGGEIISNFSNNAVEMFKWRLQTVGLSMEVLNKELGYPACRLFVDESMYIPIGEGNPGSFMRDRPRRTRLSSNPFPSPGGIDFTVMPAARQAMGNLGLGDVALARFSNMDLDDERQEIKRLVNAGIMPSAERVKEYAQASLYQRQDINKVASCVMDILRLQEERCCLSEPIFKDILIVLESR